ncbi:hypothetical protein ACXGQW_09395 [Wenyingzhuangia sp. IMCC45533]
MKNTKTYKLLVLLGIALMQTSYAQLSYKAVEDLKSSSKLIFKDDFNRSEKDDTIEDLGNGWQTNSIKRAEGHKQADLRNNVLYVKMYEHATHGTAILQTAPFDDGIVSTKFRVLTLGTKDRGIQLNFSDPDAAHLSHNGHICQVGINVNEVILLDQLTGVFEKDIFYKRKHNAPKEEIAKLLKGKSKKFKADVVLNKWYEITLLFQKDVLFVYIDKQYVGKLKSDGFDHTKANISLSMWSSSAEFDDLEIRSLD